MKNLYQAIFKGAKMGVGNFQRKIEGEGWCCNEVLFIFSSSPWFNSLLDLQLFWKETGYKYYLKNEAHCMPLAKSYPL